MDKQCFWCGDIVDSRSYDFIGSRLVYVCDEPDCVRALQDEHRAAYEDAAEALRDDYFGR